MASVKVLENSHKIIYRKSIFSDAVSYMSTSLLKIDFDIFVHVRIFWSFQNISGRDSGVLKFKK